MKVPTGFPNSFWFTVRFPAIVVQFICSLHLTPLNSVVWSREEGKEVFFMRNEQSCKLIPQELNSQLGTLHHPTDSMQRPKSITGET